MEGGGEGGREGRRGEGWGAGVERRGGQREGGCERKRAGWGEEGGDRRKGLSFGRGRDILGHRMVAVDALSSGKRMWDDGLGV